jgi:hypothetical protein
MSSVAPQTARPPHRATADPITLNHFPPRNKNPLPHTRNDVIASRRPGFIRKHAKETGKGSAATLQIAYIVIASEAKQSQPSQHPVRPVPTAHRPASFLGSAAKQSRPRKKRVPTRRKPQVAARAPAIINNPSSIMDAGWQPLERSASGWGGWQPLERSASGWGGWQPLERSASGWGGWQPLERSASGWARRTAASCQRNNSHTSPFSSRTPRRLMA